MNTALWLPLPAGASSRNLGSVFLLMSVNGHHSNIMSNTMILDMIVKRNFFCWFCCFLNRTPSNPAVILKQGQPGRGGPAADNGRDRPHHHRAGEEGLDLDQVGRAAVGRRRRRDRDWVDGGAATAATAGDADHAGAGMMNGLILSSWND